jgi:energy-converting hydrogenase Eha subunit B
VVVSIAASVTKEVVESGGGDVDGKVCVGNVVCADGLITVDGLMVVADGLIVVDGNDGALITVGTGRDLSRRCASVI